MNYYNEYDLKAAAWLRELISAGEIPPGDVDTRSITEISPHELTHYTQHHFFAGIGGWPLALRLAGWPADRPVRTGSCPCQPFSAAGKQLGTADARHLWPVFRDLLTFLDPATTFGEQVASALGREWLAGVRADLEGMGYAVGAADLCAAGAGAPHIRQRLFWVAHPESKGSSHRRPRTVLALAGTCGEARPLADPDGRHPSPERLQRSRLYGQQPEDGGAASGMEHADSAAPQRLGLFGLPLEPKQETGRPRHANAWSRFETVRCADGKTRRFEPSSFPLAHGIPGRVGLLRGYGNAIVPQIAAHFIAAYLET